MRRRSLGRRDVLLRRPSLSFNAVELYYSCLAQCSSRTFVSESIRALSPSTPQRCARHLCGHFSSSLGTTTASFSVQSCNYRAKHYVFAAALACLACYLGSVLRALAHGPQNRSGLRTSRITPLEPVAQVERSHTRQCTAQDRDKLLLSAHTQ